MDAICQWLTCEAWDEMHASDSISHPWKIIFFSDTVMECQEYNEILFKHW